MWPENNRRGGSFRLRGSFRNECVCDDYDWLVCIFSIGEDRGSFISGHNELNIVALLRRVNPLLKHRYGRGYCPILNPNRGLTLDLHRWALTSTQAYSDAVPVGN